jgi:hypothetical protein
MQDELKVGGELDAWCTTCKLMKWHTVVALVGGKPAKVECQGCHKQHQYRAQPPGTPKAPRARAAAPKLVAPAAPAIDFDARIAGREGDARVYSPNDTYAPDQLVRHPTFGVGVVVAASAPQKIEVEFKDGRKFLVHDRAGAVPSRLQPPRREEQVEQSGTSDSPRGLK